MSFLNRSRLQLIGLLAVFIVPLLIAWVWYIYITSGTDGVASRAYGELLPQALPLAEFTTTSRRQTEQEDQENAFAYRDLRHIWTLVHMEQSAACAADCAENLYFTRQIRIALGRESLRVQRVALLADDLDAEALAQHPGLIRLVGTAAAPLAEQIQAASADLSACTQCIYIIDPLGNIVMRFPKDLERRFILKDLKHLLKTSRIG